MMIPLFLALVMLTTQAQVNPDDCNCRSELLRVEIADSVLNGEGLAGDEKGFALSALESFCLRTPSRRAS